MADCRSGHTFENWAHTLRFKPQWYCRPTTEQDVQKLVTDARARKGRVRTMGAGHSFSQLLATDDTLVSLDGMNDDWIAVQGREVTVAAGIRLKELIKALKGRNLALKNLGSVTEQSIAGAIATGTHGTGIGFGSLPTQVVGAKLVDGRGNVVSVPKDERLKAVSLSLGALGILTEVTIDCVDFYRLEYNAYVAKFDHVMANLDRLVSENQRVLLWWLVPLFGRDEVVVVTKNEPGTPLGVLAEAGDPVNLPFGTPVRPLSMEVDGLWSLLAAQGSPTNRFKRILHFTADYDDALTLPLLPVFHTECEYAIPAQNAVEALERLRGVVEESDLRLKLPVEVRFGAQDDLFLSPANSGMSCWIGASTEKNTAEVYARFEPLMLEFGGRPHWGKHFTLTRKAIQSMYGTSYDRFLEVRDELDPDRVFANSFLTHVLGE